MMAIQIQPNNDIFIWIIIITHGGWSPGVRVQETEAEHQCLTSASALLY